MFNEPTYLIQFGYNGQTIVRRAVEGDYTDGVILSPTDYEKADNEELAGYLHDNDKYVLCDPQYYIPRTERSAADSYPYFESKGGDEFETVLIRNRRDRRELCEQIVSVQDDFDVDAYIAPARHIDALADRKLNEWKELTETFIDVARGSDRDIPVFASLPVYGEIIELPEERGELLDIATKIDADGFYVSVEFDRTHRYPLTGIQSVHAYLDLMTRLRGNHFEVIAGHTHHISHLLYASGINAAASGHYKNTKAFDVDRWIPEDDGFGRTVIYYYSDPLLNDLRVEQGLQNLYAAGFDMDRINNGSPYEGPLFATRPENADWKLSEASWDHYIWSCNNIAEKYQGMSLDERADEARDHITGAKDLYDEIQSKIGPLDTVEESVYDDWLNAFENIYSSKNMDRVRRARSLESV